MGKRTPCPESDGIPLFDFETLRFLGGRGSSRGRGWHSRTRSFTHRNHRHVGVHGGNFAFWFCASLQRLWMQNRERIKKKYKNITQLNYIYVYMYTNYSVIGLSIKNQIQTQPIKLLGWVLIRLSIRKVMLEKLNLSLFQQIFLP